MFFKPKNFHFINHAPDDKFNVKAEGYENRFISFGLFKSTTHNVRELKLELEKKALSTERLTPRQNIQVKKVSVMKKRSSNRGKSTKNPVLCAL